MLPFVCGAALVVATLWPSRFIGWLDGAPLDQRLEAIVVAILLPSLWYLDPAFLRTRAARLLTVALLAWKIGAWALVTQNGWCALLASKYAPPGDAYRIEQSWDARTLWTAAPPSCTAIVARPYATLEDFPAWTINVPYRSDYDLDQHADSLPLENRRPPDASYAMFVHGWISADRAGTLTLDVGRDTAIQGTVDGEPLAGARGAAAQVQLAAGSHAVDLRLDLHGTGWRFVPLWNGADLFRAVRTTIAPPARLDRVVSGWGQWIAPLLIVAVFGLWIASALRAIAAPPLVAWACASAVAMFSAGALVDHPAIRFLPLVLALCLAVPVPPRFRETHGAFLLFGLPWLAFFCGRTMSAVGRFTVYTIGDDMLTFQRFAHRIFMDGYWLEGGERAFWFQPLYRWTLGLLHVAFGDSSVGETYWDAWGLLIGALFAFEAVRRLVGFRFALAAGVLTLVTVTIGPNWYVVGRGLGDISAAAWVYLAAFLLLRARDEQRLAPAIGAGLFAALAFFTRLNHLPLVLAIVVIVLPSSLSSVRVSARMALVYMVCIGIAVAVFASRTWYYTGHFSVLAGTTIRQNGTGLGLTLSSFASPAAWRSGLESVMMIVTVQDPPRFDVRAVLVIGGVLAAIGGLVRAPIVRRLPMALVVFCLAAIVGGFVARGQAYPGRFSIHVIPVAVALSIGTIALAGRKDTRVSGTP